MRTPASLAIPSERCQPQNRPQGQWVEKWAVVQTLRETLPADTIITNGAGNFATWAHRFWRYGALRTQLAPTSGAMGAGLPAAVAAKITAPQRTVVCFAGDGDFLMTGQELATAVIIPAWCALAVIHSSQPRGPGWLLLVLLIVWAADSGAYFTGRKFGGQWFGGRKLAPRISPNKTLEGVSGGVALAMLVALLGAWLIGAPASKFPAIAGAAAITVLFCVAGDLFESLLKRHAGMKDSGSLIPGHGGVLDRVDSVLAALPVFALGKIWLGF